MTAFGRLPDRSAKSLVAEAVDGALLDSGCAPEEVELAVLGNVLGGLMQRQESCRGQVWLSESQLGETSVINVENACASGATALHQAWLSVAAGLTDVAVAVGVEKMYDRDGNRQVIEAMTAVVDQDRLGPITTEHTGGTTGSLFMGIYARWAREYAERSGATPEDFARVAVKNHDNGARNPKAQYRSTYTVEEVLQARLITEPLTLPMCAPVSDGAAALVVTTPERAARWGAAPVRVLGIAVGGGRTGSHGTLIPGTAARAYALAGVRPEQVDVAECHDAAAPAELIVMEELGLCAPGEAPDLVRAGDTEIGGALPINPSGGLESKGHPLGATGCGQVVELCDQLRDRCGDRQVAGATIALAENTGGYLGPDAAAAVVSLLARA